MVRNKCKDTNFHLVAYLKVSYLRAQIAHCYYIALLMYSRKNTGMKQNICKIWVGILNFQYWTINKNS